VDCLGRAPVASRPAELLVIERVAVLQRVGMFSAAPGHVLASLARVVEEVRVVPGEVFIERGSFEDWLFVVADGRVRAYVGDRTLAERGPGEVVGELALLAPAARSASVAAIEHTLLLKLRREPFEELIEDNADIARAVMASLARRLQELSDADAARMQG
jgi:monovalent cation:H+ antiporter, CPA1 family